MMRQTYTYRATLPVGGRAPRGWQSHCPHCGEPFVALEEDRVEETTASGSPRSTCRRLDLRVECTSGHVWCASEGIRTTEPGYGTPEAPGYGFKLVGEHPISLKR